MQTAAARRAASVVKESLAVGGKLMMSCPASRGFSAFAFCPQGLSKPQMAIQRNASVTASGSVLAERWQSSAIGC